MHPREQPPYHPPAHPAPSAKKSGSGCLIALLILAGVALAMVGLTTLGVYLFATSKPGKEVIHLVGQGAKAVGEAAKVMEDAARAPGTRELRALGCRQALVIDMARLMTAMDQFDAGLAPKTPPAVPLMVTCQVGALDTPPACDVAAATYVAAVGRAAGDFAVLVSRERSKSTHCSSRYAPDGTRVGSFHGAPPAVPGAPP